MSNKYSLCELDMLAKKAALGAGYCWGLAEDAGKSVRWLGAYGLPGAETLALLLQRIEGHLPAYRPESVNGIWVGDSGFICPIYAGVTISDRSHTVVPGTQQQLHSVIHPLLALPHIARLAEVKTTPIAIQVNQHTIIITKQGMLIEADFDYRLSTANISCQTIDSDINHEPNLRPSPYSKVVATEAIDTLQHFANKSLVPETELSRLHGAGAGLTDND